MIIPLAFGGTCTGDGIGIVPVDIDCGECRIAPAVPAYELTGVKVGAGEDADAGVGDGGFGYVEEAFGGVVVDWFW